MPDKQIDLKRRRPVWEAISELWLDTELRADDFAHIAAVLAQSKYSLDEIREIIAFEVAPVVWTNLSGVAGVWTAFDADWLTAEIVENNERRQQNFLYRIYIESVAAQWLRTKDVAEHRRKILEILKTEHGVN